MTALFAPTALMTGDLSTASNTAPLIHHLRAYMVLLWYSTRGNDLRMEARMPKAMDLSRGAGMESEVVVVEEERKAPETCALSRGVDSSRTLVYINQAYINKIY